MSSCAVMAWALTLVDEFEKAGEPVPENAVPMLPLVDVVLWVKQQDVPVTPKDLATRYNVSRATAFRWAAALKAHAGHAPACRASGLSLRATLGMRQQHRDAALAARKASVQA